MSSGGSIPPSKGTRGSSGSAGEASARTHLASVLQRVDALSPEKRALLEAMLRKAGGEMPVPPILPRSRGGDHLPLSFAQQRLWFLDQLEPGSSQYNVPSAIRLRGRLEVAALERSLDEVVRRHESLRTTFGSEQGTPFQRISPELHVGLPVVDLGRSPAAEREARARELATAEAAAPFDLAAGPLVRGLLLKLEAADHILVLTTHHIVSDGWSAGVLIREMAALYQAFATGRPSPLPRPTVQYADFSLWQRDRLKGDVLQRQLGYWKNRLAGAPPVLDLFTDRPRPAKRSFTGSHVTFALSRELSQEIEALRQREGATLFMTLLAALQVLLHRCSGQGDILVGTPIANRTRAEVEALIGFFVNTLVLRTDLSGDPTFRELLGRVRETALEAFAHQDVPFEMVVEALAPERNLGQTPLFQVMFVESTARPLPSSAGLELETFDLETSTSKFDLTFEVQSREDGLHGSIEYDTDLYDASTVWHMARAFERLLQAVASDPDRRISALPLLGDEERRRVLVEWNQTVAAEPPEGCAHRMFEAQVARTPGAIAVAFEGERLTYQELDRRANRIARHLQSLGVGPETIVAICLETSPSFVACVLGVLKAGGAWLPLDPRQPAARLAFMLEDSRARFVLTQESLAAPLTGEDRNVICLDGPDALAVARQDTAAPEAATGPEGLAYVIYTSGSTGTPKGTLLHHRGLCNLARAAIPMFGLGPEGRLLQFASVAFDASVADMFATFAAGAALHLARRDVLTSVQDLETLLRREEISAVALPPSLLAVLPPEALPALRTVVSAGEACPVEVARRWMHGRRLVNAYGPTETTVAAMWHHVDSLTPEAQRVPIGRPMPNVRAYVLDAHREPVPIGMPGELYIGGVGVGRGYLGRPELTAERFLPDPLNPEAGARMYRTGDRVRWVEGDKLEFLGRLDDQVKIRGFRVELGEIESLLSQHLSVREAVASIREETGTKRIVAYVVPRDPGCKPDPRALRDHLKRHLPDYMMPAAFVALEALPLTTSGKVDRKALPRPEPLSSGGETFVGPRTPTQEIIAGIWAHVLGLPRVSVRDSFFELGGHSLLATQVVSRIRSAFGAEMPLRSLFESATVEALAARVEEARSATPEVPPLVALPRPEMLPLSFAQQRLWFLDRLEPGSPQYNVPSAIRIRGRLDIAALERSLCEIVRRHESLRTTFVEEGGRPVQIVSEQAGIALSLSDLRQLPAADREPMALRIAREDAKRPFDLSRGPLVRTQLLRLDEDDHILLFVVHHIVSDGWSSGVLFCDLTDLYEAFSTGRSPSLADLTLQYADYARWQREWLQGETLQRELAYWKRTMAGAPPLLELPTDRPRPPMQTTNGSRHAFLLPAELSHALNVLSQREGATLFMTLLASFQALLQRYSGQDDICIGTPIANRTRTEVEDLVGFFVNTLVLRTDLSGDPSFRTLLGRVRETALDAYAHQDVPFEMLVDALKPERTLSHSPLFQAMFVLQNTPVRSWRATGLEWTSVELDSDVASFDLTLAMEEGAEGLGGAIEYNTDLFDAATIERLAGHFRVLLEAAVADPDRRLSELPLLGEEERRRVLVDWNETGAAFPRDRCLHELFEAQADRTPLAVAVVSGGQKLSYRELDERASQLARHLRALGVGPEVPVGFCLDRSPEMVVGLLGVLKAGGAYLPLDPADPQGRLAFALQDSGAKVVLTQARHAARLEGEGRQLVRLDADWEVIARQQPARLASGATPESLAYVIYTSGSTGKPKGVLVPQRAVVNHGTAMVEAFGLGPSDRMLQFASIAFDASVEELFPTLWSGACLVLRPPGSAPSFAELHRLIGTEGLTVLDLPTAYWQAWVSELTGSGGGLPPSLRLVVVGGEKVSAASVAEWQRMAGSGCAWMNTYGPTETTVTATLYAPRGAWEGSEVPIGRPIANLRAYVLDGRRQPVPVGVPGELYLGGAGLARGYLNRPELTAERFVSDPFAPEPGARIYRTGDRARWRDDGQLEYLGRLDDQVKVRGFRIELGEVESVLAQHPAVREAVAAIREEGETRRLVAYLVPREADRPPESAALREFLRERLPEYMVPSAFVALEALPFTRNGKVDRRSLPPPEPQERGPQGLVEPRTPAEETLAQIWAQLLGRERVGIHDNFFELGGDSILSIQIVSRAQQAGLHLTPRQIFEFPTVAGLAAVAGTQATAQAEQGVVTGDLPLTPIQRWFFEEELAEPHHFNQSVLLAVRSALARPALEAALAQLVSHHDALRLRFERGEAGWRQENAALAPEAPLLRWEDLSALPEAEHPQALERICGEVQRSLDLGQGTLLRAAYFHLGTDRTGRLLLVVHHLAVDGVSWRILLEDLETAYGALAAGRTVTLPPKTTSFRDWARALADHARSPQLRDELPFWIDAEPTPSIPLDFPGGENLESTSATVRVEIGPEESQALLQEVPQAYHTEVNDVLLAALAQALSRWSGQAWVQVALEGHGREEISERVDVTRTVGWFTTVYPVRLDLSAARGPGEALIAVKEALRRVPRRGLGYGLLRYLDDEGRAKLAALRPPEVSFNYLGQIDRGLGEGLFALSDEPGGAERSPRAWRAHLLDVTGVSLNGRLRFELTYGERLHRRETVEALARWFVEALRGLIEHCRSPGAGGHSPSDFPEAGLSARELDAVFEEVDDPERAP